MIGTIEGAVLPLPTQFSSGTTSTPLNYRLFDLRVRSDLRLPLPVLTDSGPSPDLTIALAPLGGVAPAPSGSIDAEVRCHCPAHQGGVFTRIQRGESGLWVTNPGVATCRLSPDAHVAEIWPDPGADEHALGLFLVGQLGVLALRRRGVAVLHASAVATRHGAIAFLGPKGHGKSTMAAGFLRRGASLLTDDILPIRLVGDDALGIPGPPLMKLWRQALAGALHIHEELPPVAAFPDKLLLNLGDRYPRAEMAVPLRALYILERYDPVDAGTTAVEIRTITGRAALTALFAQTSWNSLLRPDEAALLLPLYARILGRVPVRSLRYPNGFAHQGAVSDRILANIVEDR